MDSVIQFEGTIYEDGYGLLAQKVMRDKKLPRQSKLIYAYMCSFAGISKDGERTAFPSIKLQCDELGMSEDTYFKWRKHLIDRGFIKISKQRNKQAKFERNIYSIIAVPKENEKEQENPYPNSSGTGKKLSNQGFNPYPNSSGTEKPSTENKGTNINSSNINNKDLDTLDTTDTKKDSAKKLNTHFSMTEKQKQQKKEEYMSRAFYENTEHVPERIAEMLSVFSRTTEEAKKFYDIILIAKKKVEEETGEMIWLEHDPALVHEIINSFSRAIRKIEKRQVKIDNPRGYLYNSIYSVISNEISAKLRVLNTDKNKPYFNWLEDTYEN